MSDAAACDHPCAFDGPPPDRISLAECLRRFRREAVPGVCDTGRYRLPYYSWGSGPPLVLVHGVSDCARSFLQPVSRLSAAFRCIAYDLPSGDGDGARLRRYTHADLVADLWALLDHLRLARSYILGSSFGATVVLSALRQWPERLPRAVLQGGLAHRPLRRLERLLASAARFFPGRTARLPLRRLIQREINGPEFAGRDPEVWDYFLECSGRAPIRAFAEQVLLLHRLDLRPLLPEVRQPVLLVCGDRDRVVGPEHAELLRQGLPNAGLVVLQGCGHVPSYTHPEVYAEVVRRFLTPPDAAAAGHFCSGGSGPGGAQ
jgi:pimeloyl-ACP methyl ester carboxylesterase